MKQLNNRVTGSGIVDGSIVNADIAANAAIDHSKLANITAGQVLLGNASNVPTATALSGDVTINSSGVTAIGTGVIVDAEVAANAAIAGTKVNPNFGSQSVITSGRCFFGNTVTLSTGAGADALVQIRGNGSGSNFEGKLALYTGYATASMGAGQTLGLLTFGNADGEAARIVAQADGGWTAGSDHPGRLVFLVTEDAAASPSEAMRINNGRELLIGYTSDNGAYRLQVNSQIFATSSTVATSDGRYKENVATLGGCLDLVKALRPVSFTWKPQEDITCVDENGNKAVVREGHNFPNGTQVGFIAQEVQQALDGKDWLGSVIKKNVRPSITDSEGNELAPEEEFLGIAEGNLIAVLTSALQEAVARIEQLESKVSALESV